jgi:N-succinyldiaminopimelate aminotransferase
VEAAALGRRRLSGGFGATGERLLSQPSEEKSHDGARAVVRILASSGAQVPDASQERVGGDIGDWLAGLCGRLQQRRARRHHLLVERVPAGEQEWIAHRRRRTSRGVGGLATKGPILFEMVNSRLAPFGTTVFAEMSALALATGSVNLGQGFPEGPGPELLRRVATEAIWEGDNQYPPGTGVPELLEAVAAHQQAEYGLSYDPQAEVLATAGATEAVASAVLGLLEPGDEVLMLEPSYDSYGAVVAMAGARRVPVSLAYDGRRWVLPEGALEAAVSDKARMVLLNSPHNPTGKVLDEAELSDVAGTCRRHDLIAVTDEVYEHLVFDGRRHSPLATFEGMRERTVTISSAGKSFSVTGWKVGWACAPPELLAGVRAAKQFLTYVTPAPLQRAVAAGLRATHELVEPLVEELEQNRDLLVKGLSSAGFPVRDAEGTYFVTADISGLTDEDAYTFCWRLPERCGVVAVPCSVFYSGPEGGRHLVRFAFCKRRESIEEAVERLGRLHW